MIEPVSLERQRARALFTVMAAGNAMLALEDFYIPEKIAPKHRLKGLADRVMKWHSALCDELSASAKLPPLNARAVTDMLKRFQTRLPSASDRTEKADRKRAAAFCAVNWFALDVLTSCRDIAGGKSWRFFERAMSDLDLILSEACDPGCAGADIYLELVW